MIVQEGIGELAVTGDGPQAKEMKGPGVDVRGIPLLHEPARVQGLARNIRAPRVIAKLNER